MVHAWADKTARFNVAGGSDSNALSLTHKGLAQKWGGREMQKKTYALLENNGGMSYIPSIGPRREKSKRIAIFPSFLVCENLGEEKIT